MTINILLAVIGGMVLGIFLFPVEYISYLNYVIDIGLCILLFFVGVDIGKNKQIWLQLKTNGAKILLIPLMIALGSILGSMAGGILLGIPINESSAVGAGFGWYSFSAVELSKYNATTGALAFITNVCREILAILSIPFIAKYIGKFESIAPAGATAMDTTLPIISKANDGSIALASFITGVSLSILVPILVPLLISL